MIQAQRREFSQVIERLEISSSRDREVMLKYMAKQAGAWNALKYIGIILVSLVAVIGTLWGIDHGERITHNIKSGWVHVTSQVGPVQADGGQGEVAPGFEASISPR